MRALKIVFNSINFFDLVLRLRLNADQSDIVNFVQKGHNVLITGQAGVGKSEVVKFIIRSLRAVGKNVGVVCASGIATQVYEKGQASTVLPSEVHKTNGLSKPGPFRTPELRFRSHKQHPRFSQRPADYG